MISMNMRSCTTAKESVNYGHLDQQAVQKPSATQADECIWEKQPNERC